MQFPILWYVLDVCQNSTLTLGRNKLWRSSKIEYWGESLVPYFVFIYWAGVESSPLLLKHVIHWSILQSMDNYDDDYYYHYYCYCRATYGTSEWQGKTKYSKKPAPALFCSPQVPHNRTRARTQGAVVKRRRLKNLSYGTAKFGNKLVEVTAKYTICHARSSINSFGCTENCTTNLGNKIDGLGTEHA
jgi:hypothetical protein